MKHSPAQISQLIHQMNRMDLSKVDYAYVSQKVAALIDGFTYLVKTVSGTESLFRARVNPATRPDRTKDLMAPPPELVRGFQRCNPPGVAFFYAASRRLTALQECRVSPGDVVYLGEWGGGYDFPATVIFDPRVLPLDGEDPANNAVQTYLDTLMTRRIGADFSDEYKLTAAITEQFTTKHPPGGSVDEDGSLGIIYPSVFDRETSFNWAMPAAFAEKRLKLRHVTELVVIKTASGLGFRALDNAVAPDGENLIWKGDPDFLPMLRQYKDVVAFIKLSDKASGMAIAEKPLLQGYFTTLLEENLHSDLLPKWQKP